MDCSLRGFDRRRLRANDSPMTQHLQQHATLSIELDTALRNAAMWIAATKVATNSYLHTSPSCHILLPQPAAIGGRSPQRERGYKNNEQRGALSRAASCAGLFRSHKGVHRHGAARELAEPFSDAQLGLAAAGEDVAQVRVRAAGNLRQFPDGLAVLLGPAEHRVRIVHG